MSEAFGALRAALHVDKPTATAWYSLAALIEALPEEERGAALDYVADFMEREPWMSVARRAFGSWLKTDNPLLPFANAVEAPDPDTLLVMLQRMDVASVREVSIKAEQPPYMRTRNKDIQLEARHFEVLSALDALEVLRLEHITTDDWGALARLPLRRLREITMLNQEDYSGMLRWLCQADWPALARIERSGPLSRERQVWQSLHIQSLQSFARDCALPALRYLALRESYIESEEEEDWTDWAGTYFGRGPRRAWTHEACAALATRWPDINFAD